MADNCLVCIQSFVTEDEDSGETLEYTEGITCVDPSHEAARDFPENFVPWDRWRSDYIRGLLVCIHAFEFEDPDTGYLRGVRYGHDYVRRDDWLARHYPENFVRVEEVVPSDRIPHLPLRDGE